MTVDDIVKVNQYLNRTQDIADYVRVRSRSLGESRPALVLLVVPHMAAR